MAVSISGLKRKHPICMESNVFVPLAAFWVNFCLLGVLRSNAVIFSGLVDVFGINRQHAAWPSGMFGFFMSVTGAVSGFLTDYWSIRCLAIFGATLASLSVSVCCLAYQMELIIFFYGALQGIGVGLIVPLTHVVLNQNFSKYRAFAMGIAYSGSSVGSFVFPPVSNYILGAYDLDGAFLLLGGIMLHSVLGAMYYKTPRSHSLKGENRHDEENSVVTLFHSSPDTSEDNVVKCEKTSDGAKNTPNGNPDPWKSKSVEPPAESSRAAGNFCNEKVLTSAVEVLTSPKFLIISFAYATYFTSSAIFLMVVLDFAKGG